jgi:membrane-associated phospholipid phosphatase
MGVLLNTNILLSLTPFLLLLMFIVQYFLTNNWEYLLVIPSYYISDGLSFSIKYILQKLKTPDWIIKRPDTCGELIETNGVKYYLGTSPFPACKKPTTIYKTSGFPSGHSQIMTAFATFVTLYLYKKNSNEYKIEDTHLYIFTWLLAFAVFWQRWFIQCHTPLQIISGALIGLGLGVVYFEIYKQITNK